MPRATKACEACRRRRVKCNGELKCQQCTHLNLVCVYSAQNVSSRSRKGLPRGHVLSQFRKEEPDHLSILAPASSSSTSKALWHWATPTASAASDVDVSFFEGLVDDYEAYVFAFIPVITKTELLETVRAMNTSREDCALVYAIAAITLNMRRSQPGTYQVVRDQVLAFVTRALEIRGAVMPYHQISVHSIMISVCVYICLGAHRVDDDIAFIYVREAIASMQILCLNDSKHRDPPLPQNLSQRQRLYWLLFIHERFAAITKFQAPVLPQLSSLPELDEDIPAGVQLWFAGIVQRFSMLDGNFISSWISKDSPSEFDVTWLEEKQEQLSETMSLSANESRMLTAMQQVDLIVTSYWFRTLLWQIALSKFLLTTDTSADSMSIFFPLRLSPQLQALLTANSRDAIEVHGAGILQKIFDITNTIADILIQITPSSGRSSDLTDRIDDFIFLQDYLSHMPRFYDTERTILEEKYKKLRLLFPDYYG